MIRRRRLAGAAIALVVAGTVAATVLVVREQPPQTTIRTAPCSGIRVSPADDLIELVNGASDETFCIEAGTYDLGSSSLQPGDNVRLVGAPVTVGPNGEIDAPTKITSTATDGVIQATVPGQVMVIENLDVSGATGEMSDGDDTTKLHGRGFNGSGLDPRLTVRYSRFHDNSQSGVGGTGDGSLLEHVELDGNGSSSYIGCCSSGTKSGSDFTVTNSYVHDNIGAGIWVDVNGSLVATGNVVVRNSQNGIRYESDHCCPDITAEILRNVVQDNNTSGKESDAGGIVINSAPDAHVAYNVLGGNHFSGVMVTGSRGPTEGAFIHDNTLNGDVVRGCDPPEVVCEDV